MNISTECITCIFNQAHRVTKTLGLDEQMSKKVLDESAKMLPSFRLDLTPPQNATPMYHMISDLLQKPDLYHEEKQHAIQKAESFVPQCVEAIEKSEDPFLTATKIAVAGNVIDLASEFVFDLEAELSKVLSTPFAIDHSDALKHALYNAKTVVYLADNAGENVFDRIYIARLKALFKEIEVYYFVRSKPIINDICFDDLKEDAIHKIATVVDSGVETPGIVLEKLSQEARALFENADVILSKGMGNFECLSAHQNYPIFYLLKVKCTVVAHELMAQVGDIICMQNQKSEKIS